MAVEQKTIERLEIIKNMYINERKSDREIADFLGLSKQRVNAIRRRFGVETIHLKDILPFDLMRHYVDEGKNDTDIAGISGVSVTQITRLRKEYGIESSNEVLRKKLNKKVIYELYVNQKKSSNEIADYYNCSKSLILILLEEYGIKRRVNKGRYGEEKVIEKALDLGFAVTDMNIDDQHSVYDLEINGFKVEVKSGRVRKKANFYNFQLLIINPKILEECEYRIRLKNGYIRKLFRKVCDYVIAVTIDRSVTDYYIIPSNKIPDDAQSLYFGATSDYEQYKNRWDQLKKPDAPTSDQNLSSII